MSDVDSSRIEDPEELDSEDEETFYTGESVLRTALEEAARNDDFTLKFQVAESRQSASKFKVFAVKCSSRWRVAMPTQTTCLLSKL